MLRTLRIRIIALTMTAITIVIAVLSAAINITTSISLKQREDNMLKLISDFNGIIPENPFDFEAKADFEVTWETPFQTRYFVIFSTKDGTITKTITSNIASLGTGDIERLNNLTLGRRDGYYGSTWSYRYLVRETDTGRMVIFLNRSQDRETIARLFKVTLTISVILLICIFFVLILVSKRIIKPFVQNQEKQNQFITDAGHELKTPLAIIRANTDVLEMCSGTNEWLDSIKNQTERMDTLIKGLLQLSRSAELYDKTENVEFSLSAAVSEIALPFKPLAEKNGHEIQFDIQPDIYFTGNAEAIRTLVSILCDNAIKYTSDGGGIKVTLSKAGKTSSKTARLVVENDISINNTEDPNRFFERFYRSEGSRSRETGGYGIGLSVAKTITENQHGKITVSKNKNRIIFTVIL